MLESKQSWPRFSFQWTPCRHNAPIMIFTYVFQAGTMRKWFFFSPSPPQLKVVFTRLPLGKIGLPTKTTFNHVIFQMDNPNFKREKTKKIGKFRFCNTNFKIQMREKSILTMLISWLSNLSASLKSRLKKSMSIMTPTFFQWSKPRPPKFSDHA